MIKFTKKVIEVLVHTIMFNCFRSVEIKESGGSFSVITSTSLNPLAIKSTAKIKKMDIFVLFIAFKVPMKLK